MRANELREGQDVRIGRPLLSQFCSYVPDTSGRTAVGLFFLSVATGNTEPLNASIRRALAAILPVPQNHADNLTCARMSAGYQLPDLQILREVANSLGSGGPSDTFASTRTRTYAPPPPSGQLPLCAHVKPLRTHVKTTQEDTKRCGKCTGRVHPSDQTRFAGRRTNIHLRVFKTPASSSRHRFDDSSSDSVRMPNAPSRDGERGWS